MLHTPSVSQLQNFGCLQTTGMFCDVWEGYTPHTPDDLNLIRRTATNVRWLVKWDDGVDLSPSRLGEIRTATELTGPC